ncbi:MAG: hypothetical protein V3R73_07685, partial [Sphingomonadales bacterium]
MAIEDETADENETTDAGGGASLAEGKSPGLKRYRYYDFVMAAFVAVILLSNLIGAAKISTVAGFTFGAGVLFFPLSYVIGDVLTEVYGYA